MSSEYEEGPHPGPLFVLDSGLPVALDDRGGGDRDAAEGRVGARKAAEDGGLDARCCAEVVVEEISCRVRGLTGGHVARVAVDHGRRLHGRRLAGGEIERT